MSTSALRMASFMEVVPSRKQNAIVSVVPQVATGKAKRAARVTPVLSNRLLLPVGRAGILASVTLGEKKTIRYGPPPWCRWFQGRLHHEVLVSAGGAARGRPRDRSASRGQEGGQGSDPQGHPGLWQVHPQGR